MVGRALSAFCRATSSPTPPVYVISDDSADPLKLDRYWLPIAARVTLCTSAMAPAPSAVALEMVKMPCCSDVVPRYVLPPQRASSPPPLTLTSDGYWASSILPKMV